MGSELSPVFWGVVEKGKLALHNSKLFHEYLQTLQGDVRLVVRKKSRPRTTPQHNWYFGVILKIMSDHTGHTQAEMHEIMKGMFNAKAVTIGSRVVVIPATTTDLSTKDFSEYCERVRAFASTELNLVIPDPDPDYKDK